MRKDPLDFLPRVSKAQVMEEYLEIECTKDQTSGSSRSPTFALRLALSVVGGAPREGCIPLRFFTNNSIQIYQGLPRHPLNKLHHITGETTSQGIVNFVFPNHLETKLNFEDRYRLSESLPSNIREWFNPVLVILKRIVQEKWKPPPINVLNFSAGERAPWIIRAEHLCGQVPDGTHRVLAYTLLSSELPDFLVPIRVLQIHPVVLAIANSVTLSIRLLMDPLHTPVFKNKRFGGSAFFVPMEDRDI
jgi:hypothetical protein